MLDLPAAPWSGRDDGPGDAHARWHSTIRAINDVDSAMDAVVIGFASDEGVRRNHGRPGAIEGPAAIRGILGSLAAPRDDAGRVLAIGDLGDVVVDDGALEAGQERLGDAVRTVIDAGALPLILGGGHEVAFGTYQGVAASRRAVGDARHGVFNIDAHFDLRAADQSTSGTPFRQMFENQRRLGRQLVYFVAGTSRANNTQALFDTASDLGVQVLLDDACTIAAAEAFVDEFLDRVDLVHLTIDLDAMPAGVAPGVSAPSPFGVEVPVARAICARIARSGKLIALDIAEMSPPFDIDNHTARLAARLVDEVVRNSAR